MIPIHVIVNPTWWKDWYEFLDIVTGLFVAAITFALVWSLRSQIRQGQKILERETEQLKIIQDDSARRAKILTLEIFNSFEKYIAAIINL